MRRKKWNDIDLEFLIETYPFHQTEHIAKALGCSLHRVYNKVHQLGLKKSPEYLNSPLSGRMAKGDTRGLPSRFTKGHAPANKGKTWDEFMSKEGQQNSRKTTFKKGHVPATMVHNGQPYLTFRTRKDGYIEKLWFIQEGTNKRSAYLSYLCRMNGIDLKGKKPILRPGFDHSIPPTMEDIEVITCRENMKRNTLHRFPEDLRRLIQIKGVLNRQLNKQAICQE